MEQGNDKDLELQEQEDGENDENREDIAESDDDEEDLPPQKSNLARNIILFGLLGVFGVFAIVLMLQMILRHNHEFGEWRTTAAAGCTVAGEEARFCDCGEKQTNAIPALGHSFKDGSCERCGESDGNAVCQHKNVTIIPGSFPTCLESGLKQGEKCADCGEITKAQEIVPPIEHILFTLEAKEATCTEDGLTEGKKCGSCDYTPIPQYAIPKFNHTENSFLDVAPTCTSEGSTGGTYCSVCLDVLSPKTTLPRLDHNYVGGVCTECGGRDSTSGCTHENTEIIPGAEATCTSTGLTDGERCLDCGDTLIGQTEIPEKGHTEVTVAGYAATCTSTGLTDGVECSECGDTLTEQSEIPLADHTELTFVDIPPTCISAGSTGGTYCSVCLTDLNPVTVLPRLGHNYVGGRCTRCGEGVASEGLLYYSNGDGTCSVIGIGSCTDADIVIPRVSPDGDEVTSIGGSAFVECYTAKSIVIPDSVKCIESRAFCRCIYLESISIADSVTEIESNAFQQCYALMKIEIPSGITSIASYAFSACTALTSITVPASVQSIESRAFESCTSLTHFVIGSGVTSISSGAFDGCEALYKVTNKSDLALSFGASGNGGVAQNAKIIVNKNGEKSINNTSSVEYLETSDGLLFEKSGGDYTLIAYLGGEGTVTLPASVNGNGYDIFNMRGVQNVIIPEGIVSIGNEAFYLCDSLVGVRLPSTVTSIGDNAFFGCPIKSLELPNDIGSIGNYAFADCYNIREIVIPHSVTNIGYYAFSDCTSLTDVYYAGTEEEWEQISRGANSYLTSATIHYNYVP